MRMPNTGRGLPPKIRPDTVLAYFLDDDSSGTLRNRCADALHLAALGATPTGTVATGRTRKARTFVGTGIMQAAATQRVIDAAVATEWTMHALVRVDVDSVGDVYCFNIGGISVDTTAATNLLACIGYNAREPFISWESGVGGNQYGRLTGYDLPIGVWTLLTFRRTGPIAVDAFVNGNLFGTLNLTTSNVGGGGVGSTFVSVGGLISAAGTGVSFGMTGRLACCFFDAGLRTDDEIAEDFRRVAGLGRPSSVHLSVQVEDGLGVLVDLTDPAVMGADFVTEARIRAGIDDPCETIDVTVARNIGNLAASPLRTDSKVNLEDVLDPTSYNPHLYGYREIVARVARCPLWTSPITTDWFERFRGRIDTVDDGQGDDVAIRGRDQGGYLVDRQIDEPRAYPQTFGGGGCGPSAQSREIVMAEILADNGALATLHTPIASLSCRVVPDPPELPRGSLLQALRTEAGSLGWDCKFKWDPVTDAFRLTFFDPGRDKTQPDVLIDTRDVVAVNGGEQSLADVRTRVAVTSNDTATLNTEGQPMPSTYVAIDAVAEAVFDERLMELVEDASRGIDTTAERQRMAEAVLADVSTLRRSGSTVTTSIPEIELYDYARFAGNGIHFTAAQLAATRQVEHVFTMKDSTSRLEAYGKPAAGAKRWLDLEAGRAGPLPLRSPADALKERLGPGMLEGVLEFVNRSAYPGGNKFVQLKNGDFARFTRGDAYPPDAWTMAAGTWGTDALAETATQLSGGRAVRIATTTAQLQSQDVPIVGDIDQPYSLEVAWQRVTGDDLVQIDIQWLNAAKGLISTKSIYPGAAANGFVLVDQLPTVAAGTGTWFRQRADGITPPTTAVRFARIIVRGRLVGGAFGAIIVDTVGLFLSARSTKTGPIQIATYPAWAAWPGALGGSIAAGTVANICFVDLNANSGGFDDARDVYRQMLALAAGGGASGPTVNGGYFYCKEDGRHRLVSKVWYTAAAVAAGTELGIEVVRNGTYSLATGLRTAGTVVFSRRFERPSYAGPYSEIVVHEFTAVKGDRITLDFRNRAGAGTVQIINKDTLNASNQDWTMLAIESRSAD